MYSSTTAFQVKTVTFQAEWLFSSWSLLTFSFFLFETSRCKKNFPSFAQEFIIFFPWEISFWKIQLLNPEDAENNECKDVLYSWSSTSSRESALMLTIYSMICMYSYIMWVKFMVWVDYRLYSIFESNTTFAFTVFWANKKKVAPDLNQIWDRPSLFHSRQLEKWTGSAHVIDKLAPGFQAGDREYELLTSQ